MALYSTYSRWKPNTLSGKSVEPFGCVWCRSYQQCWIW